MLRRVSRSFSTTLYTKTHEWVILEEKGVAKMGITKFAVEQLGEVVYADLPSVSNKYKKNAVFATVESVKAVGEIYCPFNSAQIISINEDLKSSVGPLNEDPEGKGWLVKWKIDDMPSDLLSKPDYDKICDKH